MAARLFTIRKLIAQLEDAAKQIGPTSQEGMESLVGIQCPQNEDFVHSTIAFEIATSDDGKAAVVLHYHGYIGGKLCGCKKAPVVNEGH